MLRHLVAYRVLYGSGVPAGPRGLCCAPDGAVRVCENKDLSICVARCVEDAAIAQAAPAVVAPKRLEQTSKFTCSPVKVPAANRQIIQPFVNGAVVDAAGFTYVSRGGVQRPSCVQVYRPDGSHFIDLAPPAAAVPFDNPRGLCLHNGLLYICDAHCSRIVVYGAPS